MRYQYAGRLQENDLVYMFVAPQYIRLLDRLFASPMKLSEDDAEFFGRFALDPKKPLSALVEAYQLRSVPERHLNSLIGEFMIHRLGGTAEVGDRVTCGDVDLIVREVSANGEIVEVGLAVDQTGGQAQIPLFLSGEEIWNWLKKKTRGRPSCDT